MSLLVFLSVLLQVLRFLSFLLSHNHTSVGTQVLKLPTFPQSYIDIEPVLDNEVVSSSHGGFHHFLVQWFGWPQSNATWITEDEFRELNPALLEWYLQDNSPESSSFQAGEYDATRYHGQFYSRRNRKFRNLGNSYLNRTLSFSYLILSFY